MPVTIDELSEHGRVRRAAVERTRRRSRSSRSPSQREVFCPIISTDDHVVEPPHMCDGRFPAKYADAGATGRRHRRRRAARGCGTASSSPTSGSTRSPADRRASTASSRRASTRCGAAPGTSTRALADMDINGVWASVCFPSFLPGFVGQRLSLVAGRRRSRHARRCARGTTGMLEEWCGARSRPHHPDADRRGCATREVAADEIRRNAERGLQGRDVLGEPRQARAARRSTPATGIRSSPRARRPTPSSACTSGSSATSPSTTDGRAARGRSPCCSSRTACTPRSTGSTRRIPVRFPDIKICMSEGGIGWVAALIDRLDHCFDYQMGYLHTWEGVDESPAEVLQRNFWLCALDDDELVVDASPHRRRPHPRRERLPARRLDVARHAAAPRARTSRACPTTRCARCATRTPPRCSATRCRRRRPHPGGLQVRCHHDPDDVARRCSTALFVATRVSTSHAVLAATGAAPGRR